MCPERKQGSLQAAFSLRAWLSTWLQKNMHLSFYYKPSAGCQKTPMDSLLSSPINWKAWTTTIICTEDIRKVRFREHKVFRQSSCSVAQLGAETRQSPPSTCVYTHHTAPSLRRKRLTDSFPQGILIIKNNKGGSEYLLPDTLCLLKA